MLFLFLFIFLLKSEKFPNNVLRLESMNMIRLSETLVSLENDHALHLYICIYFTPLNRAIDGQGQHLLCNHISVGYDETKCEILLSPCVVR